MRFAIPLTAASHQQYQLTKYYKSLCLADKYGRASHIPKNGYKQKKRHASRNLKEHFFKISNRKLHTVFGSSRYNVQLDCLKFQLFTQQSKLCEVVHEVPPPSGKVHLNDSSLTLAVDALQPENLVTTA